MTSEKQTLVSAVWTRVLQPTRKRTDERAQESVDKCVYLHVWGALNGLVGGFSWATNIRRYERYGERLRMEAGR